LFEFAVVFLLVDIEGWT